MIRGKGSAHVKSNKYDCRFFSRTFISSYRHIAGGIQVKIDTIDLKILHE